MESLQAAINGKANGADGTVKVAAPANTGSSVASKLPVHLDDLYSTADSAATHVKSGAEQAVKPAVLNSQNAQSNFSAAFGSPHVGEPAAASPPSPVGLPAKQLDFDLGKAGATPASTGGHPVHPAVTPTTPVTPAVTNNGVANSEGAIDYETFVAETLLWVHKVRSAVYLVGGLVLIWLLNLLFTSDVSIVTGVCNILLVSCALNALRGAVSPNLQASSTWSNSVWTKRVIEASKSLVMCAAELHDKLINAADPAKMLRLVGVLWIVGVAGRLIGTTGLAASLWALVFVVPKAYMMNRAQVDEMVKEIVGKTKTQFLQLDPRARAVLVVLPIFITGYWLKWADISVAILMLLLYGRMCLAPAQVAKVNQMVSPIHKGITQVGGTVGNLVHNAVVKYDLTPTPSKKKRA